MVRLFAHSTRIPLVLLDPSGGVLWANPAFELVGQWSTDALLGQSLLDLLGGERPASVGDSDGLIMLRQAVRQHAATHTTLSVRAADGRQLWMEADLQPLRQPGQALAGFALVLNDVSARVRERQRLRSLIDCTIAGIVLQDESGRIVDCNPEAERLLGRSRAQLLNTGSVQGDWDAIHEDGSPYPGTEHPGMRVLQDGRPVRGDVMGIRLPNGERRWIEVNSQLMHETGSGQRAVVNSFINLSAQKAVEARLQAERERLLTSLEGTRAGLWEWDIEDGGMRVDARWAELLGEPATLQQLSSDAAFERMHPHDQPRLRILLERHLQGDSPFYEAEARMRRADGDYAWLLARGRVVLRAADGRPLRMFGTHAEITGYEAIRSATAQAQHLLKGMFERSPVAVVLNDLVDGRFVDGNAAFLRLVGRPRGSLLALSYWDITPPEYFDQEAEQLRSLMDTGYYGPYEKEYQLGDGQRCPVLLSGMRVSQPDGSEQIWSVIVDLSERRRLEQHLRRAALTDELTGLPNRTLLIQRLERALAELRAGSRTAAAVLFLDFDRFKDINDSLGHEAGDELLRGVALRMRSALRAVDVGDEGGVNVVARFGGDEFVVLLGDVPNAEAALQVAQRLLEAITPPYMLLGQPVEAGVSIGVVLLDADTPGSEEVLRRADLAMYQAKGLGGRQLVLFGA
ncbi:MAG: PAS domain S-box protein [Aquimonas sp.]|nr:PAS domain S-box protein [Aquimonas sp.]